MKFKSKSLISIILSIMMVMSMILVAIPANAAVINSDSVGEDTASYYLWYAKGSSPTLSGFTKSNKMEKNGNDYVFTFDQEFSTNDTFVFYINTDSSTITTGLDTLDEKTSVTCDSNFNWKDYFKESYYYVRSQVKSNFKVKVTFNPSNNTVALSKDDGSTQTSSAVYFGNGGTGKGTVTAVKTDDSTPLNTGDTVKSGTSVTFTATAGTNSKFDGWYSDPSCTTEISGADQSSTTYTKTVTAPTNVYAKFTSTAIPTTTYYIGGRFRVKDSSGNIHTTIEDGTYSGEWNPGCTTSYFKMIENPNISGEYILETNMTTSELSQNIGSKNYNPYFIIHTGSGLSNFYGRTLNTTKLDECQKYTSDNKVTLDNCNNSGNAAENQFLKFTDTDGTYASKGNVTLHFNPTTREFYYTTDGTSTSGDFKIVDKTAANGKLTFSASDKAAGTASADDEVTVTATPDKYFECTEISVSYKDNNKVAHKINSTKNPDNTFKFTVPADLAKTDVKDQEITVKGTFTLTSSGKLNYVKDQGNGLYIDVAPAQNDSTATLIKWNNYKGQDQGTNNPYTFYVPKNVDLANAVIYNTTGSQITLGGKIINNNEKAEGVNLTVGDNTITGYSVNNVKVMQGSTDAMFLHTTNEDGTDFDLPTKRNWPTDEGVTDKQASEYKAKIESSGGSCTTMDNTSGTANFSSAMGLDTVKGRGNSSWKASATMFGKYAFNMKLKSKTNLLGMDSTESEGAKSWCLLANNADESMLRNALTYQLASEIGLLYSPEFRFVDIYDNGEYMGSYLVTEKVDVGSSKLVKGKSFEDINETAAGTVVEDAVTNEKYSYGTGTYEMSYAKVTADGNTSSIASKTDGKYLLEFEITERYKDEASWFTSPRGQHVVVKSPEFATKEQVTYIAQKFAAMEDIAFTTGATKAQLSTVMDVESFAKMYLIQEFSSNLDAASTSYYLTFDCSKNDAEGNGAVFVANPVWDYDWAYGQYYNTTKKGKVGDTEYTLKTEKAGTVNDGQNYWVAKYKYFDDSKGNNGKQYSIQSQLASQNSDFKAEIRKQWEGTNGFYETIKNYYGNDSKIDKWYNQIRDSVDMNETRWGFIKSNPIGKWGSTDTGNTHEAAVNYLKTDWTATRAAWLNEQFTNDSEYAPFTPATPASTVTDLNGTVKTSFEVGESFLINVTTVEDGVTYSVYLGETKVGDNVENGKIKVVATADMVGEQTFTVKATYGKKVETSNVIVTVNKSSDVKNIKVYFKTATAPAYAPSVSFDGGDATAMTKSSELGKDYSGSLTFAWYSVKINYVDTTKNHTLTFTSKRTKLNATWNGTLTKDSYFTADNLMSGTVAVNLTDKGVAERNFFYSATNMVYDSTDAKNKTLGFTFVGGSRVKMGTVVNESNGTVTPVSAPTVKSATYIQMVNASMITVSSLQSELYDVNFDGKVDIKDATYIQYALAS